MKFLQSKIFAALLGAVIFLLTSAFLTTGGLGAADHLRTGSDHRDGVSGPSWMFFNPELDLIIADLKAEREAVALKEKQLNQLALRLRAERAELDEALRGIKNLEQQVDREVFRIKEDEAGNLKKLAKMYAAMEPAGAAKLLRELDDVIIVKVLSLMKEPETALILESFVRLGDAETRRAAGLSENLRSGAPRNALKK